MSYKMHNFRLPKEQWWDFATACRAFYLEKYPILEILTEISIKDEDNAYRRISNAVDVLTNRDSGWTVDLQIFDEADTYLIRPLEHGWFFTNSLEGFTAGFTLTSVDYDTRSDVPPEDEKNEAVAKWVDEQIDTKRYFIYNVLHRNDFMNIAIKALIRRTNASVH